MTETKTTHLDVGNMSPEQMLDTLQGVWKIWRDGPDISSKCPETKKQLETFALGDEQFDPASVIANATTDKVVGELEQALCDDKKKMISLHNDPSAVRWANEFMDAIRSPFRPFELDTDMMISWFANAMMAAHDDLARKHQQDQANLEVYVLITKQTGELIAVYSKLPCKSICDRDYSLHLGQDLEMIPGSDIPVAGQGSNWNCLLYRAKVDSVNRIHFQEKIEYQNE